MSLDALIRSALSTAHTLTADLQATVAHEAFASLDAYGKPSYSGSVNRTALVESKRRLIRTEGGRETMSRAKVTFLSPVAVGVKDRITLPDGTTGPILDVQGLVDPSTDATYYVEVWLG